MVRLAGDGGRKVESDKVTRSRGGRGGERESVSSTKGWCSRKDSAPISWWIIALSTGFPHPRLRVSAPPRLRVSA